MFITDKKLYFNNCLTNAFKDNDTEEILLNEEDEEDEVVKEIIRSRNLQTNYPPTITTEEYVVDISFHPNSDMIAIANIVGDVYL